LSQFCPEFMKALKAWKIRRFRILSFLSFLSLCQINNLLKVYFLSVKSGHQMAFYCTNNCTSYCTKGDDSWWFLMIQQKHENAGKPMK
jgi:hypothetical protein